MIRFIKENSYLIFKMMVNQLGMIMFGLVLSMATHENDSLHLTISIFAVLFYMSLLYMMCWEYGIKEKVRVQNRRIPYMPLKGLYISICANIINILLVISLTFGYLNITDMAAMQPAWAFNWFDSSRFLAIVLHAMYMGIIRPFTNYPITYVLILAPAFFASAAGYYLGLKDFRLLGFLGIGKSSNGGRSGKQ